MYLTLHRVYFTELELFVVLHLPSLYLFAPSKNFLVQSLTEEQIEVYVSLQIDLRGNRRSP